MKCFSVISSRAKTRQESLQNPSTNQANSTGSEENKLRNFSFSDLKKATKKFDISLKIGEGGLGSVYKGSITPPGGQGEPLVVAIKKLVTSNGMQGHKEWLEEVELLGVVEHPNIVKLLGYCSVYGKKEIQRLLIYEYIIYEYMPNRSLQSHLFSKELPPIPWRIRLQILLGVAKGLIYLHEGLETEVIFHGFNSVNVLLDENFNPKLSDFRLETKKNVADEERIYFKRNIVAYEYVAPEFRETGLLMSNNDLWSFGLVLYEILSGRKAMDRLLPQSEQKLIEWVKHFPPDSKRFRKIMDPRLNNQYSLSAARKVAKLADNCLRKYPKDRPAMSQIVDVLQEAIRESEDDIRTPLPESSTRRMVHVA